MNEAAFGLRGTYVASDGVFMAPAPGALDGEGGTVRYRPALAG
jgi:hypothetical protein